MSKIIEAVYDGGVFKPKAPVELEDKTEVRLLVQPAPSRQDAIQLLEEWMRGDALEQAETWTHIKGAIDEDRPSSRKLFR